MKRGKASGEVQRAADFGGAHSHDGKALDVSCEQALSSGQFDRQREHVADAALCLDDAGRARIAFQFAPQPQDLYVDATVEDIFMNAGRLKQILAAEKSLRRVEKGD